MTARLARRLLLVLPTLALRFGRFQPGDDVSAPTDLASRRRAA